MISPCGEEDCPYCDDWEEDEPEDEAPDRFQAGYKQGRTEGYDAGCTVAAEEVRRLTLENSLLEGELATIKGHIALSKEG